MVDTVLYFEGERFDEYRILRAVKNRFGSTNEIGVFRMEEHGLSEVTSPSAVFLAERLSGAPGSVVVASVEGTRSVLVELQALVSPSGFGYPRRVTEGIDNNRAALIIAVLERRVGLGLGNQDAYLKVTGGITVEEPAADLWVTIAVASSFRGTPVDPGLCVMGEVGLAGEVRGVTRLEQRVREAAKMGFRACLVPAASVPSLTNDADITITGVRTVAEAIDAALGGS
jgi:DNA repair protein RadA/Sms